MTSLICPMDLTGGTLKPRRECYRNEKCPIRAQLFQAIMQINLTILKKVQNFIITHKVCCSLTDLI